MARTEECILYRNFDNGEVLDIMTSLMNSYEAGEEGFENRKEECIQYRFRDQRGSGGKH